MLGTFVLAFIRPINSVFLGFHQCRAELSFVAEVAAFDKHSAKNDTIFCMEIGLAVTSTTFVAINIVKAS